MKKIVQLQYRSSTSGDFARRLHNEFVKEGISSSIVSLYSDVPSSNTQINLGKKQRLVATIENKINEFLTRKADKKFGLFSYPFLGTNVSKIEQVKQADVIYLHSIVHGFLNLTNIEQLAKLGKPIVIILHDMWSITGGCHYSFACDHYKTKCHDCPFFQIQKKETSLR